MKHSHRLRLSLVCALLALCSCGGGDETSGNDVVAQPDAANHDLPVPQDGLAKDSPGTPRILLEAQLMAPLGTTLKAHWAKVPEQGIPLEGYQLYCVTFATPPSAATGTADAGGQVTLWLEAESVPFGCFVLDAQGSDLMKCSDNSKAGLPVTLNEGAFSFSFQHDPNHCPSRMASVKATPTQGCDGMVVEYSYGPCESCQEGECGCETGTQICATTVTAYRE